MNGSDSGFFSEVLKGEKQYDQLVRFLKMKFSFLYFLKPNINNKYKCINYNYILIRAAHKNLCGGRDACAIHCTSMCSKKCPKIFDTHTHTHTHTHTLVFWKYVEILLCKKKKFLK